MRNYYQSVHRQKHQRGKIVPGFLVVLTCAILGLLYLSQVNSSVTKSYQIRDYRTLLREAQRTQQEFQVQLAQWQTLPKVKELIEDLEMVDVEEISYLKISDNEVAAVR